MTAALVAHAFASSTHHSALCACHAHSHGTKVHRYIQQSAHSALPHPHTRRTPKHTPTAAPNTPTPACPETGRRRVYPVWTLVNFRLPPDWPQSFAGRSPRRPLHSLHSAHQSKTQQATKPANHAPPQAAWPRIPRCRPMILPPSYPVRRPMPAGPREPWMRDDGRRRSPPSVIPFPPSLRLV